jgi:hypothetical protein
MRKNKPVLLGKVFGDFIKENGLSEGLLRIRVFKAWDVVVGENIIDFVEDKYFIGGKLVCRISSAAVRNSIFMERLMIKEKINEIIGEEVVKEIILK